MKTTAELQALHAELWAFREEMAGVWPTPEPLDSLRFSFTEAGEAMDAYLRVKGGYARNHAKEPDVLGELADCAMMLMTALGSDYEFDRWSTAIPSTLEDIGSEIGVTMLMATTKWRYCESPITGTLWAIAQYPGMDLPTELRKRMARIRAKHGKADTAATQ